MKCENIKCQKEYTIKYGSGRFCSRACANSRNWSEEDKQKKSINSKPYKSSKQKTQAHINNINIINNIADEEFTKIYNNCKFIAEVLKIIGVTNIRNNRFLIREKARKLSLPQKTIKKINTRNKGNLFTDRTTWQSARSAIQKNARTIYRNSDKPKQCIRCGYDKHYEVCHINSVSSFSTDTEVHIINNIDNLMALCPNCHWENDNLKN